MAYRFSDLEQSVKPGQGQSVADPTKVSTQGDVSGGQTGFGGAAAATPQSTFQSGKAVLEKNKDAYSAGTGTSNKLNSQISGQIKQQTQGLQTDAAGFQTKLDTANKAKTFDVNKLSAGDAKETKSFIDYQNQGFEAPGEFGVKYDPSNTVKRAESGQAFKDVMQEGAGPQYGVGAQALDGALFNRGTGFTSLINAVNGEANNFTNTANELKTKFNPEAVAKAEREEFETGRAAAKNAVTGKASEIQGLVNTRTANENAVLESLRTPEEQWGGSTVRDRAREMAIEGLGGDASDLWRVGPEVMESFYKVSDNVGTLASEDEAMTFNRLQALVGGGDRLTAGNAGPRDSYNVQALKDAIAAAKLVEQQKATKQKASGTSWTQPSGLGGVVGY